MTDLSRSYTITHGHYKNINIAKIVLLRTKLMKNRCRLKLRRHFFSERVVNRWNGLDQHVIDSATLNSFKTGLDRIRKTSIGFFMD